MMADAGITNSKISDSDLVIELYKHIQFPDTAQAIFNMVEILTPSENSALGQVLGNREKLLNSSEEASQDPQPSISSAGEV